MFDQSWWQKSAPGTNVGSALEASASSSSSSSSSPVDASYDVIVIGAGLTGTSCAYFLSKFGLKVLVLDGRRLAGGASGRNGGHLHPHSGSDERAMFETRAVADLLAFLGAADCDLRAGGAAKLHLRSDKKQGAVGLDWNRAKAAAATGTDDPDYFSGAQFDPAGSTCNPAKIVLEVARRAEAAGAAFRLGAAHAATAIATAPASAALRVVTTAGGARYAPRVATVVATNAALAALVPSLRGVVTPRLNQVLVTEPVPGPRLWSQMASWAVGRGAHEVYCHQLADGSVLIGGARSSATDPGASDDQGPLDPAVSATLRATLARVGGRRVAALEVAAEWWGALALTPDGVPLVGQLGDGMYVAGAYNGHGMPFAHASGKAIAERIAGRPSTETWLLRTANPARFDGVAGAGDAHKAAEGGGGGSWFSSPRQAHVWRLRLMAAATLVVMYAVSRLKIAMDDRAALLV